MPRPAFELALVAVPVGVTLSVEAIQESHGKESLWVHTQAAQREAYLHAKAVPGPGPGVGWTGREKLGL